MLPLSRKITSLKVSEFKIKLMLMRLRKPGSSINLKICTTRFSDHTLLLLCFVLVLVWERCYISFPLILLVISFFGESQTNDHLWKLMSSSLIVKVVIF